MQKKELNKIVKEITGEDYRIKKPMFKRVYRLEKPGLISKLSEKTGKAGKTLLVGLALATASIPAQSALDALTPNHNIVSVAKADNPWEDYQFGEDQAIVLGGNMLINGLVGGFGARHNNESFWQGLGKGLMGGVIIYGGKELASHVDDPELGAVYGWSGKAIHSLGVSMVTNITEGRGMFDSYQIDVGPVLLDFDDENKYFIKPLVLPGSVGGILYSAAEGNKLSIEDSLKTGTLVFEGKIPGFFSDADNEQIIGGTMANIINIKSSHNALGRPKNEILRHEIIHTLQFREGTIFDWYVEEKLNNGEGIYAGPVGLKFGPDFFSISRMLIDIIAPYGKGPLEFEAYKGYSR